MCDPLYKIKPAKINVGKALVAVVAIAVSFAARATTWHWTGGGGDLNWFTPANWNSAADGSGSAPTDETPLASGDSFTFDAVTPSGDVNYNPSGDFNITTITFGAGLSAPVRITGGKITRLGNAVNNNASHSMEFANEVQFSSAINLKSSSKSIIMSGGAFGTAPANHATLYGKYTLSTGWTTGDTAYTLAEDTFVKVNGGVNVKASYKPLTIKRGAVLDLTGTFSATPKSDGDIVVFNELSGTVIAREGFRVNCWTGSANSGGYLNIAKSMQTGTICTTKLNITPLNSSKIFRFRIPRIVCLGGLTYTDEQSRWAGLVFPVNFTWVAGGNFSLPAMTSRSGGSLYGVSFAFDTTDYFDKTTGRTITINGNISNANTSERGFSAYGNGKIIFNCNYSNFAGGFTASNGVSVAINAGAKPGNSWVNMREGTSLSLPQSGVVTLGGRLTLADGVNLSFHTETRDGYPNPSRLEAKNGFVAEGTVNVSVDIGSGGLKKGEEYVLLYAGSSDISGVNFVPTGSNTDKYTLSVKHQYGEYTLVLRGDTDEQPQAGETIWHLAWKDDFDGPLRERAWTLIEKGPYDWNNTMVPSPELAYTTNGILTLVGRARKNAEGSFYCETGGVRSRGKYAFLYGKIEFRAKFESVTGSWPAAWMTPDPRFKKLTGGEYGEIDIIERLNSDSFVYETVHTSYSLAGNKTNPVNSAKGNVAAGNWNIYALEWLPEGKLVFKINGSTAWTYNATSYVNNTQKWPFVEPYQIMFDMQLGGEWVGSVDYLALYPKPIKMQVDWVRYYTGERDGVKFGRLYPPPGAFAIRMK